MATLKQLIEASGIQEIAPGRTVGEQVYDSSINTVSPNTDLGSDTYARNITPLNQSYDPFFSGLQQVTKPIGSFLNRYGAPVIGGLMSLASGIPGLGLLTSILGPKPYDQNLLSMYGGYGRDGRQDKFGYNVVSMMDNYMQPGSSSYRSYALQGLNDLNPQLANDFYQQNYGLTFDQVKNAIQSKQDPFGSAEIMDMGADYQGDGGQGSGGQFDGAASQSSYDSDPTGYSGSF